MIRELNPVTYQFKEGMGLPIGNKYGFISQEVGQLIPELVSAKSMPQAYIIGGNSKAPAYKYSKPNEVLFMDYTSIIPFLTKASQELDTRVVLLEKENQILKERLRKLELMIREL